MQSGACCNSCSLWTYCQSPFYVSWTAGGLSGTFSVGGYRALWERRLVPSRPGTAGVGDRGVWREHSFGLWTSQRGSARPRSSGPANFCRAIILSLLYPAALFTGRDYNERVQWQAIHGAISALPIGRQRQLSARCVGGRCKLTRHRGPHRDEELHHRPGHRGDAGKPRTLPCRPRQ